jgi:hypothetical protein
MHASTVQSSAFEVATVCLLINPSVQLNHLVVGGDENNFAGALDTLIGMLQTERENGRAGITEVPDFTCAWHMKFDGPAIIQDNLYDFSLAGGFRCDVGFGLGVVIKIEIVLGFLCGRIHARLLVRC